MAELYPLHATGPRPDFISVRVQYRSLKQRDLMHAWVRTDRVAGQYMAHYNSRREWVEFYFSDPDAAFAFKMCWG